MEQSHREKFLNRLSTAGGGMRESLQMAVGAVVCDLRDQVEKGLFNEEEIDAVISFHDDAETVWREMLSTNPLPDPRTMTESLRRLESACAGPLAGFRVRMENAREKAEIIESTRSRG